MIGHITLGMKQTGERNAGKPHVAFDAAGAGNGFMNELMRHSQRKRGVTDRLVLKIPRQSSTLPTQSAHAWLVEKTFGWLKLTGPLRQTKYRGLEKVNWSFVFSCAAHNLLWLPKLITQQRAARLGEQCV